MSDVYLMVGAGFVGYYLIRHDYGVAPIILGIILGPLLENNLRRALVLSDGDFGIFLERPIALTFLALTALSLFLPLLRKAWNRGRA
jgi:putative tricarboxylic transport membrane protein